MDFNLIIIVLHARPVRKSRQVADANAHAVPEAEPFLVRRGSLLLITSAPAITTPAHPVQNPCFKLSQWNRS